MKRRLIASLIALTALVSSSALAGFNPEVREIDLDVDSDYNGSITDADDSIETSKGGIVMAGGWTNITFTQTLTNVQNGDPNTVRLAWTTNHIELCESVGGAPITPDGYMGAASYKDYPGLTKKTLWVHGISSSSTAREDDIRAELIHFEEAYDPNTHDEINITVINMDLDAFWPEKRTAMGVEVAELEENSTNLCLAVNDDDDNDDLVVDNTGSSSSSVDAEDDEVAALIVRQFVTSGMDGTLTLEVPNEIKLYDESGNSVATPVTVDLSAPSGNLAGVLSGDVKFFMEAAATSSCATVLLKYSPTTSAIPFTNTINMVLVETEVTGGFTRGSVQYATAVLKDGDWSTGGRLDSDHPLNVFVPVPKLLLGTPVSLQYDGVYADLMWYPFFESVAEYWNELVEDWWAQYFDLAVDPVPSILLYTPTDVCNALAPACGISATELMAGKYWMLPTQTAPRLDGILIYKRYGRFYVSKKLSILQIYFDRVEERNLMHSSDRYQKYEHCIARKYSSSGVDLKALVIVNPSPFVWDDTRMKIEIETPILGYLTVNSSGVLNSLSIIGAPAAHDIRAAAVVLKLDGAVVDRLIVVVYPESTETANTTWVAAETARGTAWLSELPKVFNALGTGNTNPEDSNCNPKRWISPSSPGENFHFNAAKEMRSQKTASGHGHQACYDSIGNLITGGDSLADLASAGTADLAVPVTTPGSTLFDHVDYDVWPFIHAAQLDGNPIYGGTAAPTSLNHTLIRIGPNLQKYYQFRPPLTSGSQAPGCLDTSTCSYH